MKSRILLRRVCGYIVITNVDMYFRLSSCLRYHVQNWLRSL